MTINMAVTMVWAQDWMTILAATAGLHFHVSEAHNTYNEKYVTVV